MKKLTILILASLLLPVLLIACTASPTSEPPTAAPTIAPTEAPAVAPTEAPAEDMKPELPAEIVLPIMGPFTGPYPAAGEDFKQGAEMAAEEINANGGIRGSMLKLEYFDTKLDPTEAANLARKVVADERFPILIGPWSSSSSLAILPILEEAGMALWTPAASSAQIAESPWGFKISTDIQIYGSLMTELGVKELGFTKLAIIYAQNDFAMNMKSPVADLAAKLGGEVVIEEGFTPDTQDFRAILSKIKETDAEALLVACYSQEGALIVNQAKELGLDVAMIGDGVFYDTTFFDVVGENKEGLWGILDPDQALAVFDASKLPKAKADFYARFEERYGEKPEEWEIPTYDVIKILASLFDEVGLDRTAVRDALEQVKDYPGVSGSITIGKLHWPLMDLAYMHIENGVYVVWKDAPEQDYAPR
ncbi:MAG: ABC transporter substrate-binding protein [Anaerolineales bacterium]|nr:ABC transporter substrate-binding protein [Anaerolineales bacterium]